MSNYYEYRDVKVMIAHMLMNMEGWKVYGYKADESDMMVDYWSPADWGGIAEKNGYILCVNVHGAAEQKEVRKYNNDNSELDRKVLEKINKLKEMTVERGASEAEAESARKMILRLQEKSENSVDS